MITFAQYTSSIEELPEASNATAANVGLWVFIVSAFVVGGIVIYIIWSHIQADKKKPAKKAATRTKTVAKKAPAKKPAAKKKPAARKKKSTR